MAPPALRITGLLFPDAWEQGDGQNRRSAVDRHQKSHGDSSEPTARQTIHRHDHSTGSEKKEGGGEKPGGLAKRGSQHSSPPKTRTRMRPPRDVIKLEDRLHYLLQPPLESLLAAESLHFPHQPFPFQLEGVAFLAARREAVLADEMGLGKTMQAITTMRLLAKLGSIRRVLLVCPKPVVTNWRRELALWAPELPVAVIAGNRERRAWQWCRGDSGVTIANYEVVVRDQDLLCAGEPIRCLDRPETIGVWIAANTSTWWCSMKRSGSRTATVPRDKRYAPFPEIEAGH